MNIINTKRFKLFYLDDNIVIFSPKEKFNELESTQLIITNHTENTWEKNRDKYETNRNTKQGKVVEEFFIDFIEYMSDNSKNLELTYKTYDEIRLDNFKKHAPFDGLLFNKENSYVDKAINMINKDISNNKYGKINKETIKFCTKNKVYLVEIKSSKIPDRIYNEVKRIYGDNSNSVGFQKGILGLLSEKMDFFKYPVFTRNNGTIIHNTEDYLEWVRYNISFMRNKSVQEILDYEISESLNIYTRIFIDDRKIDHNQKPIFIGYFLGYVLGYEFYNPLTIMNFPSDKSKNAIYATYPISRSRSFEELFNDERLW